MHGLMCIRLANIMHYATLAKTVFYSSTVSIMGKFSLKIHLEITLNIPNSTERKGKPMLIRTICPHCPNNVLGSKFWLSSVCAQRPTKTFRKNVCSQSSDQRFIPLFPDSYAWMTPRCWPRPCTAKTNTPQTKNTVSSQTDTHRK